MGTSPSQSGIARLCTFYRRETWIEGRAEDQLTDVSRFPGMQAVAGFPDLHPGRFGPVGAAFLADRIWPQLVGPDIGCGMALFRLDLPRHRLKLDKAVRRLAVLDAGAAPERAVQALAAAGLAGRIGAAGLGTIGGGNHFCELQVVAQAEPGSPLAVGTLCLLVHSGSRSLGARVLEGIGQDWRQGFAPGSAAARDYLALHDLAEAWARLNRRLIAETAAEALGADLDLVCDAVHNHLIRQGDLWLHRKGAASVAGGLVPLAGSREAESYLLATPDAVPEALASVSHGAGRRYDRSAMHGRIAKTRSDLAALSRTRFGGRVVCADRDLLIEEAGAAYKSPAMVVADLDHFGLARRLAVLEPLITWKTGGLA
ncbi:release factor H-coupled RctB family protein [Rhodobacter viridis]|uniref:3'-phosphate/5'-hydroxy nucleic acid ligase n=1 Tax=Rhodobacter viridis TaxID=1054202 RepID=A0A318U2Q9_9RHOB|nr:RNA ligase RtcB family protein [Rhodobacter viridis]PYF10910.1 release factor H-coupled RctB family protein [Rhodobacter viridis]